MPLPLLEPGLLPDPPTDSSRLDTIQRENRRLESEIRSLKASLVIMEGERDQARAAIKGLQQVLSPLHRSLRALFGEIEPVVGEVPHTTNLSHNGGGESDANLQHAPSTGVRAIWESWISKLGGKPAEIIRVLLEHREMTVPQLKVATHSAANTVYNNISKLSGLGLINKNGGRYSLKEL